MLHLRLFGPEGIKSMEWLDVWSHSLKRCLDIEPDEKPATPERMPWDFYMSIH